MTLIRRTNPLGELVSLRQAMNRLSEVSWVRPRVGPASQEHPDALDVFTGRDSPVAEPTQRADVQQVTDK